MILDSNSIWGATVGFNLGANTQGCYVGLANIYENTTNPIVDTGSGNIINLTNAGGFVGIGKANPQQRLDVAGAIACTNGFVFSGGPGIFAGSGSPQGALTAPMGSLFLRTDAGTLFVKQTGSGNSGWVAK
jgi:hypothetical protein